MTDFNFIKPLVQKNESKIILLVLDGLGGLPKNGKTELETAGKPNMNKILKSSSIGQMLPIASGITPGSGPGHLGLFGYDPQKYILGRGILEAIGINFKVQHGDLCTRINFATVDDKGNVTDRRAGRIPTELNKKLCARLGNIKLKDVDVFVEPVKEHRAAIIFRGQGLFDKLCETDPQKTGVPPIELKALDKDSQKSQKVVNDFFRQAKEILKDEHPANMIMFRGWANYVKIPSFNEVYGLKAAAVAGYPMYRGLAKLTGMDVIETESGIVPQTETLSRIYKDYDFFFVHIKYTDSAGEDGDFERKVKVIEEVDAHLPEILKLNPDVFVVTGDHSTPAVYKAHSWHPIPALLKSKWVRPGGHSNFCESECVVGSLGTFKSKELMSLILAHAGRLSKFGA
ncbi:MAG: 2,3-bisphosphoglycerate-independent phosphoglycerate mutase [Candidatus Aureabacteria bacterium]|nr:2,3-bisphosphoglycerate-independent phosphoglycerate mutase [Candidatus Auribacterota bacterium]